ncbi:MAG: RNA polymerase factor sigma-54 [Prevotellaceae bacterium]|nr:RNA polymerase factor sigma-54 [Prevotellaceae bacterium]
MLNQSLYQRQQQRLSPLQIQLIRLLELPVQEFNQRVQEELDENPALEENNDDEFSDVASEVVNVDLTTIDSAPDYHIGSSGHSTELNLQSLVPANNLDLQSTLLQQLQLRKLSQREQTLGVFLIGYIDDDGYIRRPLSAISDDLAFTQNLEVTARELGHVLKVIQDFDPAGIGARNLQECLLLQLHAKAREGEDVEVARKMVATAFDDFINKRYDKIKQQLSISDKELKQAFSEVVHLNPKPGGSFSGLNLPSANIIFPDFIVEYKDGVLQQSLTPRNIPSLKVAREYRQMLQQYSVAKNEAEREAVMFARQKVEAAKWFIDAIKQRQLTLVSVMSAIVERQKEVFITGEFNLIKPLILKDISEKTGYDLSTVSRVVSSKYVQTNFGIYSLKDFFSEGMQTESGEEVSTRKIKQILADCITTENKKTPLSDEALMEVLKRKGYIIARRTIAKYREQLGIPIARLRKTI